MKYPIGIQTFEKIIDGNYVYIDKTKLITKLLEGDIYFLSRPRRFGKSLLLSTLSSIFEGRKDLFKGLYIEEKITWKKYPIIHLSLNSISNKEVDLRIALWDMLLATARMYDITLVARTLGGAFQELIEKMASVEKVVLLIDEYDKPLISFIEDTETFEKNRGILKEFYGVIKDMDRHLKFVFITGVSRFAKVSLFSDLNSLRDISLDKDFCDICGYSEADMQHYFGERMGELAVEKGISATEMYARVRKMYNGYNFYGKEKMYNPWSVLNFMATGELENYWFETGTPTFMTQIANKFQTQVEGAIVHREELGKLRFDAQGLNVLLYQTGYLTIDQEVEKGFFCLKHPNQEVSESFTRFLLAEYAHNTLGTVYGVARNVHFALKNKDAEALKAALNPIFANIPYQLFQKNTEAYYHSVLHLIFMMLYYRVESEVSTNKGRIDMVLLQTNEVWLVECKLDASAAVALTQIIDKDYAGQYRQNSQEIYAIGINFNSESREVDEVILQKI